LGFIKDEIFIVLGTASSESVLPRLLEKLPLFGCSKQTVGLVLPTGYAFNLDGTSMYMSMGVLFLANAYNVPLDFGQQLGMLGLMLLTSKGAATVTGGSFVVFAATVAATGILPLEGLAVLFGVYRFMSIAIATTNVIGNCVATVVTAKICGEFDEAMSREAYARVQRGEDILSLAETVAKRQDFEIEGDLLQARDAGHAIVDEAIERQADAIVLGVPFRKPFGEFEMGKVPAHVLRTAQCEVILLRMPAD